jgi:anti-sigma regulatory factor (Ser/Thr protein kinase)
VRIETTRLATPVLLRHAAGFHAGPEDLLAQVLPIVSGALGRGEAVALAVRAGTERALREALGSAAGVLTLSPPAGPDGASGQTLAACRARELRELVGEAGPVTAVVEHDNAFDGVDGSFWTELDAAVNIALADLPVRLTCFFPELPLHLEITRGARANHRHLLVGGELRHNPDHRCPRDVLGARQAPAPVLLGPPDLQMRFSAWQLHEVRATVEAALLAAGYGTCRAEDVVLAVNEVATNAVEHGTIEARLLLWMTDRGLACEVHDAGRLGDPLPGLRAPHPAEARGRGVWIARQLSDTLHVWADGEGTHVRLRAAP